MAAPPLFEEEVFHRSGRMQNMIYKFYGYIINVIEELVSGNHELYQSDDISTEVSG